jgi:endonuclease G
MKLMIETKYTKKQVQVICFLFFLSVLMLIFGFTTQWELPKTTNYKCHTGYCFEYSPEHKQSLWVAYCLTKTDLKGKATRKNDFEADTSIATGTAHESDYKKSGFDMGHLKPAADNRNSQRNMDASFLMVNISPQTPALNRMTWKKVEDYERDLLKTYDSLFVVTGPILENGLKKIGKNKVSVPRYFYKCIVAKKDSIWYGTAFLVPNGRPEKNIWKYHTSIDSIETLTKIDFYYLLPDPVERKVEK